MLCFGGLKFCASRSCGRSTQVSLSVELNRGPVPNGDSTTGSIAPVQFIATMASSQPFAANLHPRGVMKNRTRGDFGERLKVPTRSGVPYSPSPPGRPGISGEGAAPERIYVRARLLPVLRFRRQTSLSGKSGRRSGRVSRGARTAGPSALTQFTALDCRYQRCIRLRRREPGRVAGCFSRFLLFFFRNRRTSRNGRRGESHVTIANLRRFDSSCRGLLPASPRRTCRQTALDAAKSCARRGRRARPSPRKTPFVAQTSHSRTPLSWRKSGKPS